MNESGERSEPIVFSLIPSELILYTLFYVVLLLSFPMFILFLLFSDTLPIFFEKSGYPGGMEIRSSINWIDVAGVVKFSLWICLFSVSSAFTCLGFLVSYSSRVPTNFDRANKFALAFTMNCVGTIIGIMVALIFLGGFVGGLLFPSIEKMNIDDIFSRMYNVENWAKLMVWSFVAGFSERLFPNIIANLALKFSVNNDSEGR